MSDSLSKKPLRLLVVCPSWVGDAVMATPALRRLRTALPGAHIGGLCRPGIDQVLSDCGFFDEIHLAPERGVLGPKRIGFRLAPMRYDTALLLTNSFSTALIARIAGIRRRVGYDRDARGWLLTDRITPERTPGGSFARVAALTYYWRAAGHLLGEPAGDPPGDACLELGTSERDEQRADAMLDAVGISVDVSANEPFALLNPGASKAMKRWPADRFGHLAKSLSARGLRVVVNGSPAEEAIVAEVIASSQGSAVPLTGLGGTLGSLKALTARAHLMVTNDTGPRHIALAMGTPVVTLFGPTDHRWTIVPTRPSGPEAIVLADPTLPADQSANDHRQRCRVDRIELVRVEAAVDEVLDASASRH